MNDLVQHNANLLWGFPPKYLRVNNRKLSLIRSWNLWNKLSKLCNQRINQIKRVAINTLTVIYVADQPFYVQNSGKSWFSYLIFDPTYIHSDQYPAFLLARKLIELYPDDPELVEIANKVIETAGKYYCQSGFGDANYKDEPILRFYHDRPDSWCSDDATLQ